MDVRYNKLRMMVGGQERGWAYPVKEDKNTNMGTKKVFHVLQGKRVCVKDRQIHTHTHRER